MECWPDRQQSTKTGIGVAKPGAPLGRCVFGSEHARRDHSGRTCTAFADMSFASLRAIAIVIDTRGYTEIPPTSPALVSIGLTSPAAFRINVLDPIIEADSMPLIATCLAPTSFG